MIVDNGDGTSTLRHGLPNSNWRKLYGGSMEAGQDRRAAAPMQEFAVIEQSDPLSARADYLERRAKELLREAGDLRILARAIPSILPAPAVRALDQLTQHAFMADQ